MYFIARNGHQFGPFTNDQLEQFDVRKDDLIWCIGMSKWEPASNLKKFRSLFIQESDLVPPPLPINPPSLHFPTNNHDPSSRPHSSVSPEFESHRVSTKIINDRRPLNPLYVVIGGLFTIALISLYAYINRPSTGDSSESELAAQEVTYSQEEVNQELKRAVFQEKVRFTRENILDLVTSRVINYDVELFGGLYNIQVQVENKTDFNLDEVDAMVVYYLANGDVYHRETLRFKPVMKGDYLTLYAPSISRGTKVDIHLIRIYDDALGEILL